MEAETPSSMGASPLFFFLVSHFLIFSFSHSLILSFSHSLIIIFLANIQKPLPKSKKKALGLCRRLRIGCWVKPWVKKRREIFVGSEIIV